MAGRPIEGCAAARPAMPIEIIRINKIFLVNIWLVKLVWKCKQHFGHVGAPVGNKNTPMPPKRTFKQVLPVACSGYVEEKRAKNQETRVKTEREAGVNQVRFPDS